MKKEVLIKVEGVSKKFSKDLKTGLKYGVKDLFSNVFGSKKTDNKLRPNEFWSLKDINFQLHRGECLGLIGHNGAGKSTLLKILNGLINPDEGTVTIRGRVSALIELGAGFNPILTGRENIYNNGAILGFSKIEIDSKVEEIIDFAEIKEFIDMPVQNYSSGMRVRLGFAVASQMEPDVLIIDEVLAVGDVAFRMKCYNVITSLLDKTAIIFVSHSMPQVSKICTSALLLQNGVNISESNNVSEVILNYFLNSKFDKPELITGSEKARIINKSFFVNDKKLDGENLFVQKGNKISLNFEIVTDNEVNNFALRFVIYDNEFKGLMEFDSFESDIDFKNTNKNSINVDFQNELNTGDYSLTLIVLELLDDGRIGERLLRHERLYTFKSLSESEKFSTYIPFTTKSKWLIKN